MAMTVACCTWWLESIVHGSGAKLGRLLGLALCAASSGCLVGSAGTGGGSGGVSGQGTDGTDETPQAPWIIPGVPNVAELSAPAGGPASLVAILDYFGFEATEEQLVAECVTDLDRGAPPDALAWSSEAHGLPATSYLNLDVYDLSDEIVAGRPVLVLAQAWPDEEIDDWTASWSSTRYLVVIGIDPGFVYFEDPMLASARGYIGLEDFILRWHGTTADGLQAAGLGVLFDGYAPALPAKAGSSEQFEPVE